MHAADYAYFRPRFIALAHRGGAEYGPNLGRENTVHAFGQAISLGYRYLETDVHVTSDGVLVAFHDERLDRVTDAAGLIAELPWSQVSKARVGGWDPIPTFAQLLEEFPTARFNVDIKAPKAIAPLVEVLREHAAFDRVCVSSFDASSTARFRSLTGGRVATGAGRGEIVWNILAPGLPRLLHSPAVAFQVPMTGEFMGRERPVLTRRFIDNVHASGRVIHVWTIDDAATMESLIDMGVDGLVSDKIDVLKDVLISRGLWEGTQ